jgi:hypothetical protein
MVEISQKKEKAGGIMAAEFNGKFSSFSLFQYGG